MLPSTILSEAALKCLVAAGKARAAKVKKRDPVTDVDERRDEFIGDAIKSFCS